MFFSKSLSRICLCQSGHCTDHPCSSLLYHLIFLTGVNTNLIHLLFPRLFGLFCAGKLILHAQPSACNLKMGQTIPLTVSGNLKHFRSKFLLRLTDFRIFLNPVQQLFHTFNFQCRAEITRIHFSLFDQPFYIPYRNLSAFQICL